MGDATRSRDQRAQRSGLRLAGVRTSWHTVDDGDFFCPACGGDRSYRRRAGRRRFVLLGVPLLSRGRVAPVLECAACHGHFGPEALDHPTTNRLALLLRDAVHAVALAVLTAGGRESRAAREAAVHSVRSAGYTGCTEEQLVTLLAALAADRDSSPSVCAEIELHEALAPLAPHLAPAGRESLLLHGARIALADGPYCAAEREALEAVGRSLRLEDEDVDRLLAQARTPH
ncbi:TerB family tellurite resistance protein [Streptomyces sp. WMMB 322]|uniref:TerB family tellurite resistance protein n=1 Tax=Streptomyces sp. WMMB 322 TaxID=1286821 RepID=UPI0006E33B34|nr:TerB family tellurite resistance protein [Streptomyces sp. WMMB 322]SCK39734.1 Tellurite resistance protein TerB [Streptomyces sp. WMMB 322]